jgi:hypothetical protein
MLHYGCGGKIIHGRFLRFAFCNHCFWQSNRWLELDRDKDGDVYIRFMPARGLWN